MSENKTTTNEQNYEKTHDRENYNRVQWEFLNSCEREEDQNLRLSNPIPSVERPKEVLMNILETMEVTPQSEFSQKK